jgi:type IV pilus assembly protein PilY1
MGADLVVFQASYKTRDWSGDVRAYPLDLDTGELLTGDPIWSAAESLNLRPWQQRKIYSFNGSLGIEFNANQLTDAQKLKLGPDFENIVRYVRGQSTEGYRIRSSKLGDIVHSSPVFEAGVLYVGANDGMLHAFEITTDADGKTSGNEIFAYVPGLVFENLKEYADPGFIHKYFVDLTPTVAKGSGLLGGNDPETILVGGLGKGGKGYFALDVTAPGSMAADHILWEFPGDTHRDQVNDVGYSFSRPVVVMTNSDSQDESWAVIFGNGYESANGNAVLFILKPQTGAVIKKIQADHPYVPSGNGLSSPVAVDVNFDHKVDFVYAGDLYGNMWKFDLTANDPGRWGVAYHDGIDPQPLFKAQGPNGAVQPVTSKPEVMFHPQKQGLMVMFGTGKLLGDSDVSNNSLQSVYGIWDYGDRLPFQGEWGCFSKDDDREYLGAFKRPQLSNQPQNVTLARQTSDTFTVILTGEADNPVKLDLRAMSGHQPTWKTRYDTDPKGPRGEPNGPDIADEGTSHAGWYYDLPLSGERVISDLVLRDGRLQVICFRPGPDRCSAESSSFFMELNAFTGGNITTGVFDLNQDGVIDLKDTVISGYDNENNPVRIAPAGIKIPGNLQPPIVLRLGNSIEVSYLSSSTGAVHVLKERAARLGVTYWKELEP